MHVLFSVVQTLTILVNIHVIVDILCCCCRDPAGRRAGRSPRRLCRWHAAHHRRLLHEKVCKRQVNLTLKPLSALMWTAEMAYVIFSKTVFFLIFCWHIFRN